MPLISRDTETIKMNEKQVIKETMSSDSNDFEENMKTHKLRSRRGLLIWKQKIMSVASAKNFDQYLTINVVEVKKQVFKYWKSNFRMKSKKYDHSEESISNLSSEDSSKQERKKKKKGPARVAKHRQKARQKEPV